MPAGIGETLRQARVAAGIELEEAERTIRIRIRYLDALENEEWDVLPAEAYVRGFLHTYADYLGLDGAALVAEYERLAGPAEAQRQVEVPLDMPHGAGGGPTLRQAGAIALALGAGLIVLFVVLGITGGSSKNNKGHPHRADGKRGRATVSTTTTSTTPSEASVTLTPTGTVWVCLVDQSGKPLVNGETLTAGDSRGPFKSRELKLTLGNGEIRIELNGKPVAIPSSANPVGFDLTAQGAKPLATADRPTCA